MNTITQVKQGVNIYKIGSAAVYYSSLNPAEAFPTIEDAAQAGIKISDETYVIHNNVIFKPVFLANDLMWQVALEGLVRLQDEGITPPEDWQIGYIGVYDEDQYRAVSGDPNRWEKINWDPQTVVTKTKLLTSDSENLIGVLTPATTIFVSHAGQGINLAYYIINGKLVNVVGTVNQEPGFDFFDFVSGEGFTITTPTENSATIPLTTTVTVFGTNQLTLDNTTSTLSPWIPEVEAFLDQEARALLLNKLDQFVYTTENTDLILNIAHTAGSNSKLLVYAEDALFLVEHGSSIIYTPINTEAVALFDGGSVVIGDSATTGYKLKLVGITSAKIIPLDSDAYTITADASIEEVDNTVVRTAHTSEILVELSSAQYLQLREDENINPRTLYVVRDENPSSGSATLTSIETYSTTTDNIVFNSTTMHD